MASVWGELRRRNVVRVAVAYAITSWLILQLTDVLIPLLTLPEWVGKLVLLMLVVGFPLALFLAWAYELTPEGLKKEKDVDRSQSITYVTGRKLDFIIIAVLALALVYFAYDKFLLEPTGEETAVTATTQPSDPAGAERSELSIAVLPFVNMSSDPEQEFFSDGISEELLNMLAQLPGLHVAARTSSFQFKGMNPDIAKIADTLNVAHILEGSVRKSGTKLRITAQLIKADDGFHLWSHTYDRELDDIFAVQDEIATAISDALKVTLALDVASGTAQPPAVIQAANTQAYEAFLRGRQLIHRRGRESLEDAVRHLERALRLDERFAPAHAHLAIATTLLLGGPTAYGDLSLEEVRRRAIPHLERALELEPNLAEAHGGLALLSLNSGDLTSAIEYAHRALELNPSYIDAMNWLSLALSLLGEYHEQEGMFEQILTIDPLSIIGRLNYAGWLASRHEIERSHEVADALLEQNLWAGYSTHADAALNFEGRLADGLSWSLQAYAADPGDMLSNTYLVQSFSWVGEHDEARRISDSLTYMVDIAEGQINDAIQSTQRRLELDANYQEVIVTAADVLYLAGRFDEARPIYERLLDFLPEGRPINNRPDATVRLALSRRKAGDELDAQAAIEIVKKDMEERYAAGFDNQFLHRVDAMLAAYENDPDTAFVALNRSLQLGLRDPLFFDEPVFNDIKDDLRFTALRKELDRILAAEHKKVLQLICFNNPAPGAWQPLPETCEGVGEQLVL
jgi:TolB-like protein/Tfp pilus assembly protein PilF